ncbi:MAG: helix-turn-helix domain-containing protein [Tabrizicola sp.]|jgi:IclR family pca regulon transcriptional regulator|nr:helix-turn-helix domain-containing protein [Tabrizicola sp.]
MSSVVNGIAETDKEFVTAIARAMTVMEAFDAAHPEMNLSEIAALTGISPATVRRCLHTLSVVGYIRQTGRKFRLGPRVLSLAQGYRDANRIEDLVGLEVQRLVEAFDDPSSVAVLDGFQVVYVATIARPSNLRPSARIGTRYPAHATSLGKVLLACAEPSLRATYLARPQLEAPTDRTLADPAALAQALIRIGQQGYAVSIDELDYGVASIAVPIFDAQGRAVAAINSSGYSGRHSEDSLITGRLKMLKDCARAISARLTDGLVVP